MNSFEAASELSLGALYENLLQRYGEQNWWPADSPFEVVVGAILVQHTSWQQASIAVAQLKRADLMEPGRLLRVDRAELELLIRPAGTFRIKSERLRAMSVWLLANGGSFEEIGKRSAGELRTSEPYV